jgi:hypothetical protein
MKRDLLRHRRLAGAWRSDDERQAGPRQPAPEDGIKVRHARQDEVVAACVC